MVELVPLSGDDDLTLSGMSEPKLCLMGHLSAALSSMARSDEAEEFPERQLADPFSGRCEQGIAQGGSSGWRCNLARAFDLPDPIKNFRCVVNAYAFQRL